MPTSHTYTTPIRTHKLKPEDVQAALESRKGLKVEIVQITIIGVHCASADSVPSISKPQVSRSMSLVFISALPASFNLNTCPSDLSWSHLTFLHERPHGFLVGIWKQPHGLAVDCRRHCRRVDCHCYFFEDGSQGTRVRRGSA